MHRALIVLAIVSFGSTAHAVAAPAAELTTSYLIYPRGGSFEVPRNTLVFASFATAMRLEDGDGNQIAALVDPGDPSDAGFVFQPTELLDVGTVHVFVVPDSSASNYAGPDVPVEIGAFVVGDLLDDQPLVADVASVRWAVRDGSNQIAIGGTRTGARDSEPVQYELDVADADTSLDGTADLVAPWSIVVPVTVDGDQLPQIEPSTASYRLRVIDAAGNVSAWTAPASFALVDTLGPQPADCSAAPGRAAPAGLFPLVVLALAAALRRFRAR